jgi:hypothetical protein
MTDSHQFKGFAGLTQSLGKSFSQLAWGSPPVDEWERRTAESQRLSDRRRIDARRRRIRRREKAKQFGTAALMAFIALGLLILLKLAVG